MPLLIHPSYWVIMTIRQEADGESFEGKVGVAEVIRNRARTRYNSDGTLEGTVLRPYQFSGWNTNDPNRIRIARIDTEDANTILAAKAYNKAFEEESNLVHGANLYHSILMKPFPSWSKGENILVVAQIGRHIFYKDES